MILGSVRRFDSKGRIQIPTEIRSSLELDGKDLNVYVNDVGDVVISRPKRHCPICAALIVEANNNVCKRCAERYYKGEK